MLEEAIRQHLPGGPHWAAEVGVHRGHNAANWLKNYPTMVLFMVDHWYLRGEEPEPKYKMAWGGVQNYNKALEATDFARERRVVVPLPSVLAASLFADNTFDLVFLDGDHSRAGTLADLEAWWPKVRWGGLLGGHDYKFGEQYGWDVAGAVQEFTAAHDLKFKAEKGRCFHIRKECSCPRRRRPNSCPRCTPRPPASPPPPKEEASECP